MKKSLLMAGVISTTLMLGACGSDQPQETSSKNKTGELGFGDTIVFYTDPSNGCDYIIFDGNKGGNITPRMNPDGTQMCN